MEIESREVGAAKERIGFDYADAVATVTLVRPEQE